jgi:hypothetical protein
MKKFISGILIGSLVTGLIFSRFISGSEKNTPEEVKVTQVSGEKITHSGFNYKNSSIKFKTEAEGKGEIITEIPKTNVPEARKWMQNTNAVMVELQLIDRRIYGLSYLKRWDNFSAGGGVLFSEKKFEGIKIQTGYWFSL